MLPDYIIIGRRIREFRMCEKITQASLAEQIDMSPTYISHVETGKKKVSLSALMKISDALNVTVDCVLSGSKLYVAVEKEPDILQLFDGCSAREIRIIYKAALAVKTILREET